MNKDSFEQSNANICGGDERPSTCCIQYFNKEIKDVYSKMDDQLSTKPDKGNTMWVIAGSFAYTTLIASVLFGLIAGFITSKVDQTEYDKDAAEYKSQVTSLNEKIDSVSKDINNVDKKVIGIEQMLKRIIEK